MFFLCFLSQQVSAVAKGGPYAQLRGRRQLPQTPLTPRPAVAFKTVASSSAPSPATGHQARSGRGLPEHDHLLEGHGDAPTPVACVGSDASSTRRQLDSSQREDFQDAVNSHGGGHPIRTAASATAASSQGTAPVTAAATQRRAGGVPNGYHFTLGSASRGTGGLREREEDDWC